MDLEDLRTEIRAILDPEPEPDWSGRDLSHSRLTEVHRLNTEYLKTFVWEGSTAHPCTRLCPTDAEHVHELTRNLDVRISLFESALRLFGESIVAYHGKKNRRGALRYYPPIILTFWSGFETFVRYSSELLVATVRGIPPAVTEFLQEFETNVDRHGKLVKSDRNRPVLDRYTVLMKYAYQYEVARGEHPWQRLEKARKLRDYYTHLDVTDPRSLATSEVLDFIEAVLLGIIWPSCEIGRTQLLGVYNVYWTWDGLRKLADEYVEQPTHKDMPIDNSRYLFYCPFDDVDVSRFPNMEEERLRFRGKGEERA